MSAIKTLNFSILTDPKLACSCGHSLCDKRMVKQSALNNLQMMRADLNRPIILTSGGRCPNHKHEIKKPKPGDHQLCEAVDIECGDINLETKIKVLAGRYGATRVAGGAYCGFVHVAWTETDCYDVPTWVY